MIRSAKESDAERLAEIYGHYVKNTAVSFEYEAPGVDEFRGRIAKTLEKYPYLVLEAEGRIVGYAYAGPLKTRAAYFRSVELSIYIDKSEHGKGYGKRLYEAIEESLKALGIRNLYACICSPAEQEDEYLTRASEAFHTHMGYRKVGEFHGCGYKFGRCYNIVWMEKII